MKIIKKDGRIQEFDQNKIFTSIDNASRDLKEVTLNESDIRIIVDDIVNALNKTRKDGTPTSSYEIIGVVSDVLYKDGFGAILKAYIMYD